MHVDPVERCARDDDLFRRACAVDRRASSMPVVWKRRHGRGPRSSTARSGMSSAEFDVPEMARPILLRAECCGAARPSPRIRNPILPGFNPDPSICRVGDDYYIATSTFEWFPGVQIHHSRDLANWRLVSGRSIAPRSSTCVASRIPAASGRRACPMPTAGSGWSIPTSSGSDGAFKDAHNLHRHRARDRGRLVRPGLRQLAAASTRRCSMTTTAASGSSTWSGTTAPAGATTPGLCRHRAAGMGRRRPATRRRARERSSPAARIGLVEARISTSAAAGIT